jgi:hypothetical protein
MTSGPFTREIDVSRDPRIDPQEGDVLYHYLEGELHVMGINGDKIRYIACNSCGPFRPVWPISQIGLDIWRRMAPQLYDESCSFCPLCNGEGMIGETRGCEECDGRGVVYAEHEIHDGPRRKR